MTDSIEESLPRRTNQDPHAPTPPRDFVSIAWCTETVWGLSRRLVWQSLFPKSAASPSHTAQEMISQALEAPLPLHPSAQGVWQGAKKEIRNGKYLTSESWKSKRGNRVHVA